MVTARTDEICAAIKDIFEDNRSLPEPAGALAVAGLKRYVAERGVSGQTLVAIESDKATMEIPAPFAGAAMQPHSWTNNRRDR